MYMQAHSESVREIGNRYEERSISVPVCTVLGIYGHAGCYQWELAEESTVSPCCLVQSPMNLQLLQYHRAHSQYLSLT